MMNKILREERKSTRGRGKEEERGRGRERDRN